MTEPTSPGWFEDPEDPTLLRYFDGVVWTRHTTPRHPQPAPSAPRAPAEPAGGAPVTGGWPGAPAEGGWSAPPQWQRPADAAARLPDGDVLAPWWRRLLGRVVDAFVTSLLSGLLSLPFLGGFVDVFRDYVDAALSGGAAPDDAALQAAISDAALPVTVIGLVVGLVYEVGFLVWRSATPGKMLLGTVVRPVAGRGPVGAGVALRRQAIHVVTEVLGLNSLLAVFAFFLSVLDPAWLLWDARRQTLHDKVADTLVVLRR